MQTLLYVIAYTVAALWVGVIIADIVRDIGARINDATKYGE